MTDHSPSSDVVVADLPATDSSSQKSEGLAQKLHALPRRSVIFLVELYRTWISPTRMPTCRFDPTCSGYAVEALTKHGFVWGGTLSVWRLLKCGPWHKPGYDPVPESGPRQWIAGAVGTSKTLESDATASPSDRGQ